MTYDVLATSGVRLVTDVARQKAVSPAAITSAHVKKADISPTVTPEAARHDRQRPPASQLKVDVKTEYSLLRVKKR